MAFKRGRCLSRPCRGNLTSLFRLPRRRARSGLATSELVVNAVEHIWMARKFLDEPPGFRGDCALGGRFGSATYAGVSGLIGMQSSAQSSPLDGDRDHPADLRDGRLQRRLRSPGEVELRRPPVPALRVRRARALAILRLLGDAIQGVAAQEPVSDHEGLLPAAGDPVLVCGQDI